MTRIINRFLYKNIWGQIILYDFLSILVQLIAKGNPALRQKLSLLRYANKNSCARKGKGHKSKGLLRVKRAVKGNSAKPERVKGQKRP
ncbi:hypothetical protein Bresa_02242|uniref:Uncharacterized protein n=1 Tax=Brenneria salicis ATCC 15712 = DSM 30166 TaxID=714314 RepID=A0A366I1P6_9GAMM|nr:hypothetical protein [Brenneria salicis ATCC 15712 = DSM 30166]RBP61311.1 hypothetical protein DES54_12455 [Brenneria salicis ATCC 15712 = DSM 30166]RLM30309.1 hypothetical protein BHG07_11620 [Brenneria salicis ATCC 15712 = DSM 30166]